MCVTWLIHVRDVTHSCAWRDLFMCVTWLIHVCDTKCWCVASRSVTHAWHDSFVRVTRLNWSVQRNLMHARDVTRCMRVTWLDVCVWHDSDSNITPLMTRLYFDTALGCVYTQTHWVCVYTPKQVSILWYTCNHKHIYTHSNTLSLSTLCVYTQCVYTHTQTSVYTHPNKCLFLDTIATINTFTHTQTHSLSPHPNKGLFFDTLAPINTYTHTQTFSLSTHPQTSLTYTHT